MNREILDGAIDDSESVRRPYVVAHVATALDGATRGFTPQLGEFYELASTWHENVTLAGSETILAQEAALAAAQPGPGPDPSGPLLAVVDSRSRVTAWKALREAGHWSDVVALRGRVPGALVDLAATLHQFAGDGARVVRVDSGGRLIGVLLERGLLDEVSLLAHPTLGAGPSWTTIAMWRPRSRSCTRSGVPAAWCGCDTPSPAETPTRSARPLPAASRAGPAIAGPARDQGRFSRRTSRPRRSPRGR